jgi:hypothetical protein
MDPGIDGPAPTQFEAFGFGGWQLGAAKSEMDQVVNELTT